MEGAAAGAGADLGEPQEARGSRSARRGVAGSLAAARLVAAQLVDRPARW